MNFAAPHYKISLERGVPAQIIEGKAPSLIESIKMSKMNNPGTIPMEDMTSHIVVNGKILPETPLATGSYKTLLARPVKGPNHWQLRYQNGYMPYFNSQSELPKWEVLDPNHLLTLPLEQ